MPRTRLRRPRSRCPTWRISGPRTSTSSARGLGWPCQSEIFFMRQIEVRHFSVTASILKFCIRLGPGLTVLRLTEVWHFRYSFFKAVKTSCPNLVTFAVIMSTKNVIMLTVDKDLNLQLNEEDGLALAKMRELQLIGPLGCDVARYGVPELGHACTLCTTHFKIRSPKLINQ